MKHLPKDGLKWVAAAFALVATATAEYEIARAIGMNQIVAASVPGALDAYVVRALMRHREVLTAVLAMVAVNAASHLVTAGILPVDWPLITAVSAIAPLVLWRVHALRAPGTVRKNLIWTGTPDGHASTDDEHIEHDRAPDNPEPPGTREHPENVTSMGEHPDPIACTQCGVWFLGVPDLESHQREAEHGVVHGASTDDLDVPAWVNPPSTPIAPVHAPYVDHVDTGTPGVVDVRRGLDIGTPGVLDLSKARARRENAASTAEHTPDPLCPACSHPVHVALACEHAFCDCVHVLPEAEHNASTTRTADDWNLEHVSTGVLEPDDTEHMERARELFHTIGGVPPYRALKEGTPGMGTPRAQRIRAALKIEAEGTE